MPETRNAWIAARVASFKAQEIPIRAAVMAEKAAFEYAADMEVNGHPRDPEESMWSPAVQAEREAAGKYAGKPSSPSPSSAMRAPSPRPAREPPAAQPSGPTFGWGATTDPDPDLAEATPARPSPSSGNSKRPPNWPGIGHSEPPPQADKESLPAIELVGGNLGEWIDEAERALISQNVPVYQYGDFVARTAPGAITTADGKSRVALRIVRINTQHMIERFSSAAAFLVYDGRSKSNKMVVCPASIAQGYLERVGNWNIRPLLGIASSPTFRRNGTILDQPGYDPQTFIFYDPRGMLFPPIAEQPTHADAIAALNIVAELYQEIPFTDEASLSVALSADLCAVSRFGIDGMPLHGFTASAAGSGKSMCADIASIMATGTEAPAISIGTDPEELKKSLGAELSSGAPVVSLDNCEYPVGGELINQVLTQAKVRVRVLGLSKMIEIPRGALLMANGNGLIIVGDLVRRTIMGTIDPKEERPWLRKFTTENPVARAKRERGRFVSALLTVLRAYHVAKYQRHGKAPLGGFADWDGLIRGALIWCGRADPCETMEHLRIADPKRGNLAAVLHRWHEAFGQEELTTGDAIKRATDRQPASQYDLNRAGAPPPFMFPELRDALLDVAGDGGAVSSKRLGQWLRKNRGGIADGLRIEERRFQRGYQFWKVVKV